MGDEPKSAPKNGIGMAFVAVPAGEYRRGFQNDNHDFRLAHEFSTSQIFRYEEPAHGVRLSRGFDLGVTEVTVAQFRAFVDATGYVTDAEKTGGAFGFVPDSKNYVDRFQKTPGVTWREPGFEQSDDSPVVAVSWRDAQAFCQWLTKREGQTHRLPTEAEWEYACRAGSKKWYAWGTDPEQAYDYANVADGALEAAHPKMTSFQRAVRLGADEGDGFVYTAPAGSFKANAWGFHDMQGNVWEWVQDRWADDAYKQLLKGLSRQEQREFVAQDPIFEDATDQHEYGDWRVLRGGAWTCGPATVRCSVRALAEAGDAAVYTGFRVVRER